MSKTEAAPLLALAVEVFISELTKRSWMECNAQNRNNLAISHMRAAVKKSDMYDFLIDTALYSKPSSKPNDDGVIAPARHIKIEPATGAFPITQTLIITPIAAHGMQQYYTPPLPPAGMQQSNNYYPPHPPPTMGAEPLPPLLPAVPRAAPPPAPLAPMLPNPLDVRNSIYPSDYLHPPPSAPPQFFGAAAATASESPPPPPPPPPHPHPHPQQQRALLPRPPHSSQNQ
ncbi:hypothetical protein B0H63DRAFT_451294 [Podospora didyma]|uniref:Transcription factor CBF/NF-Y/archaeal histone domain-containing protein n=1 Tax=Podospora didyma TaxID=330526 RepID=A0AAE0TWI9_9PEZI|nr:hypothetical protein B0H63DRAFT_451294 [Podospora didyma]